ncbi:hypothetical protein Purlil1_1805 [Purpureocillium lilacinum]|uniref:Uncharacterized protein n=1 Tax=Purpureocillium lilacinum TaxID=33203 RepID=A0ABR0CBM8_PURLI|nr:hypothetical protein Purlil1_1805 [Purpureocillium lilacinum]
MGSSGVENGAWETWTFWGKVWWVRGWDEGDVDGDGGTAAWTGMDDGGARHPQLEDDAGGRPLLEDRRAAGSEPSNEPFLHLPAALHLEANRSPVGRLNGARRLNSGEAAQSAEISGTCLVEGCSRRHPPTAKKRFRDNIHTCGTGCLPSGTPAPAQPHPSRSRRPGQEPCIPPAGSQRAPPAPPCPPCVPKSPLRLRPPRHVRWRVRTERGATDTELAAALSGFSEAR